MSILCATELRSKQKRKCPRWEKLTQNEWNFEKVLPKVDVITCVWLHFVFVIDLKSLIFDECEWRRSNEKICSTTFLCWHKCIYTDEQSEWPSSDHRQSSAVNDQSRCFVRLNLQLYQQNVSVTDFPVGDVKDSPVVPGILSPHRSPANALDLNFDIQPSRSQPSVSLNWSNRRGKHLPSSWCIHWSRWIHPATRDTHTSSVFPTASLFHSVCAWLCVRARVCARARVCVSSRFRIADKLKETLVWSSLKVRVNTNCRETFSDSSRTLNEKQPRLHNKFARASTVQLVVLSVPRQNKNVSPTRKMGLKRLNAGVKSIERWMYQVLIANYATIPQLSSAFFFCGSGCFMGFRGLLSSVWQRRFQLQMDRNEDDDLVGLS